MFNEEDRDVIFDKPVNDEDFEKSDTEIEAYGSRKHLKYSQELEDGSIIILDDLNEKKNDTSRG